MSERLPVSRDVIAVAEASKPAGPYSQAIRSGDLLFISGQGPYDGTGELQGETFAEQARTAFDNLALIAKAAGGDVQDMVRLGAYLEDYTNFAEYNDIMGDYLSIPYPARTTIPVPTLGISIELDAVIALPPLGARADAE